MKKLEDIIKNNNKEVEIEKYNSEKITIITQIIEVLKDLQNSISFFENTETISKRFDLDYSFASTLTIIDTLNNIEKQNIKLQKLKKQLQKLRKEN